MKRSFFVRGGLLILMAVAFLMPLMLAGARQSIRTNKNNVGAWLPANCEETASFQWYRRHFESDMFVLVSWEGCTLDDQALPLLAKKLIPPEDPHKRGNAAPIRFFKSALTGKDIVNQLVENQGLEPEEAIERLKGFVIGPDGKQTCLVLTVCPDSEQRWDALRSQLKYWWSTPESEGIVMPEHGPRRPNLKYLHAVVERIYDVAENECAIPREKMHLGGPPVDNAAIDVEGERTLYRLAGVSAAVGLLISWWCLRSWALTGMVFTSALFTAGLSLVVVWLCRAPMNAILMTMPSLVYVAAVSGAIHLANYYRDDVRRNGFEGAPDRTVRAAWLPLALATGTTAIGLLSMCVTNLVPIRMFGLYSAIGVVISFFVVCLYMPSLLHFFPLKNIAKPAPPRLFDPGLSPKWRHVGNFIIRRSGWVAAACLALMAAGAYGVSMTRTSVKLMRLFSPDARIIHDYAWLEKNLGPLVPMEVVVRVDRNTCELDVLDQMKLVAQIQQAMMTLEDVGSTQAAPTFTRSLPGRPSFIERQAWKTQIEKHRGDLGEYLVADGGEELWRISARVAALTNLDYGVFIAQIRECVEPVLDAYRDKGYQGISATYTGLVPLIYQAQSSMLDGLLLNFVGDLILIGIAIIFLLRNFSAGLLLALPSLFPMAIVFGVMGFMGIVIDVGTVMVPAVALGVTVDDAIHFMLWCRHGEERGMTKHQAIMFAYEDCARAIYQSWGVIGLGLFSFALSSFTPTQRFGYLMFTMLTASSVGNLVMLPALLASPAGRFFWLGRKARKHQALHQPEVQQDLAAVAAAAAPPEPARVEEPAEPEEPERVVIRITPHTLGPTVPHGVRERPPRRASRPDSSRGAAGG